MKITVEYLCDGPRITIDEKNINDMSHGDINNIIDKVIIANSLTESDSKALLLNILDVQR